MNAASIPPLVVSLAVAPALPGIAQRTKALLSGRRGPPLLQLYFDLWKLLRKGTVVSRTSSTLLPWLPIAVLASTVAAALFVPLGRSGALLRFPADFMAFFGLLALARYALVLIAWESGSSFEGMGASREVTIAAFAEPAMLLCIACLTLISGARDLSGLFGTSIAGWAQHAPALALMVTALFVLLLAESGQVPVDDPTTHLELTMIHEVMVFDLGGPDLGFVQYAAAVKFGLLATLLAALLLSPGLPVWGSSTWAAPLGAIGVTVAVGVVAGLAVRLRLDRLPQFLTAAIVLASLALVLTLR